jgi:hypothetical protein
MPESTNDVSGEPNSCNDYLRAGLLMTTVHHRLTYPEKSWSPSPTKWRGCVKSTNQVPLRDFMHRISCGLPVMSRRRNVLRVGWVMIGVERSRRWSAHVILGFLALLFGLAPLSAEAVLINTYSFTQGGYANAYDPSITGVLTGSFTGIVGADDTMNKAGLSKFNATFTLTFPDTTKTYSSSGLPFTFSFLVGGGASTLSFLAAATEDRHDGTIGPAIALCIGVAVALDCRSTSGHLGVFGGESTDALPVMTLVSSVNIVIPPTPPVAVVPLPPAMFLFAAALALLGVSRGLPRSGSI